MRRIISGAVIVGAVVAASAAGCSSHPPSGSTKTSSTGASAPSSAAPATTSALPTETRAAEGDAKVTIGGKARDVKGEVSCSTGEGAINILIAQPTSAIAISVSEDASKVHSVGLGSVDGVSLSFQEYAPGVEATATRDGNTYTVKGTATGFNSDDLNKAITETFEITVTCP